MRHLIEPAHLPVDKMRRALPTMTPPAQAPAQVGITLPPPTLVTRDAPPDLRRRVSGVMRRPPILDADGDEAERQAIIQALDACAGNQTKAAQMLGVARRTLINRIERYGLPRPKKA